MALIPLPKSIEISNASGDHTIVTITPCYPGYGVTLGNALRRVLLGSLPGAAITSVKVKGVSHEFSAIPGVKEDMVSIILNLKMVRLRLQGLDPITIELRVKGDRVVKAKDFKTPSQVTIVNGDQTIATITDKNTELELEATVEPGRGYIPVENREKEKLATGMIALDAVYTPIKNVNFEVEHVRVEQMTNFDSLKLDISTDGTITAEAAFTDAAKILLEHFDLLANRGDSEPESAAAPEPAPDPEIKKPSETSPKKRSSNKTAKE